MVPNAMRRRGSWRIAGDLPASFRYAAQGLGYAFLTQRNFRIHVVTGLVVFGLATWLQLDLIRLAVLVLTVAAVLVLSCSTQRWKRWWIWPLAGAITPWPASPKTVLPPPC